MTESQFQLFEEEFISGRDFPTSEKDHQDIKKLIYSEDFFGPFLVEIALALGLTPEIMRKLVEKKLANVEMGISRFAVQIRPGELVPYAK